MATLAHPDDARALAARYRTVRQLSLDIAAPLSDADATIQPMPDASPAKWHLAHTSWFFETFVLRDHLPGYRVHDERWAYLFNSYYEGEGERHARPRRGMLSRPSLDDVRAYRARVDEALLGAIGDLPAGIITLGLNHEQQHQELMLMDLTATFAENPLHPALWPAPAAAPAGLAPPPRWVEGRQGIVEIGHAGAGFAFDCEGPRHGVFLARHALADRPVTNAEWLGFIEAGGYAEPLLWLSDGWAWVQQERIEAPLYWLRGADGWSRFGLDGLRPLEPRRAGLPHLLLRGRRLRPLGRRPAADRGGMGSGGAGARRRFRQPARRRRPGATRPRRRDRAPANVRRRLGMDRQRLSCLSGLRPGGRRGRRV